MHYYFNILPIQIQLSKIFYMLIKYAKKNISFFNVKYRRLFVYFV